MFFTYGPDADRLFLAVKECAETLSFPAGAYVVKQYGAVGTKRLAKSAFLCANATLRGACRDDGRSWADPLRRGATTKADRARKCPP
jgi:hypothetical protein